VLDVAQIMRELKEMRIATGKGQAKFSAISGVSLWSVKAVEGGIGPLHVEDLDKWLTACKSSTVEFITRHAALHGLEKEIDKSEKTKRIVQLFKDGMRDKAKRREIALAFHSVFGEELDGESLL